jgi:hypothetical protein
MRSVVVTNDSLLTSTGRLIYYGGMINSEQYLLLGAQNNTDTGSVYLAIIVDNDTVVRGEFYDREFNSIIYYLK